MKSETTVLEVGGLSWATSEPIVEKTLARRAGVLAVEANVSSQTATVTYDPDRTSVARLAGWVIDCGYHCAGQSVPDHMCDPMSEPATTHTRPGHTSADQTSPTGRQVHAGQETAKQAAPAGHAGGADRAERPGIGHAEGHGGGSMQDMVRDMRNRFLVAAALSVVILLWSPIGRGVLGFTLSAPSVCVMTSFP